jgi:hypothetical protein
MKGKMIQHKHPRAAHAKGGKAENPMTGDWAHDEAPEMVYAGEGSNVVKEAKEKKAGGRAKRKHGGMAVQGAAAKKRADRAKRKSGGRAGMGSDKNPLSSAHAGKEPAGHHSYEPEHT